MTIDIGLVHRDNLLKNISYQYEQWNNLVRREKSVYHTLNMLSLDVTKKCLVAEGWSPFFATNQIQDALQRAAFDSKSQVGSIFQVLHTTELPPTYFRTNKFTTAFQEIVDAYGYQFVPQLIFLNSLFGYLSLIIIVKWCTGSQADLYHVMIYMFLSPTDDLGENQLFPGQKLTQLVLLFLALISVPWMLLPKPFLLKKQHQERHQGQSYALLQSSDIDMLEEQDHGVHDHEEFEFSEVFVHQLIHTIEFVLGAVSNTASYLRLWALSLAHSELSTVFYEKVLLLAWGYNNIFILIIGAIVFVFATIGVLLVMETLSAFLHALRLHWVEFQNRFYEGDGYKFAPFSFSLLADEEE